MRFLKVQLAIFVTVCICILLASGSLLSSTNAWKGLGLLIMLAVLLGLGVWIAVAVFTSGPMDMKQAVPLAIIVVLLGFAVLVLLMGYGREWLRPVLEPFQTAGMWWPIASFIGASIAYLLAQPNPVEPYENEYASDNEVDKLLA